ncbi:uncharacterized protein SAPINGB_P001226 [Magnusiomyces paraingens]|uniref:RNB domain-containing protein n=1 Tax=Magnusiomyces paraingens TaxID=2606893 RepID=A0A5E8BAV6_9ASCO|nr:uncharacterized protein SAPINGB_P001226 [Saprochaete ingens]VVT46463.1 unnamed protein product [Saprochaete ingens]
MLRRAHKIPRTFPCRKAFGTSAPRYTKHIPSPKEIIDELNSRHNARSFTDIIADIRLRQNQFKETVGNDDPKIVKSLTFPGIEGSTKSNISISQQFIDQQMYLGRVLEGDLIETRSGDLGVIVQVPDFVTVHEYAVVDHQGSVSYYTGSGRSFTFKIPRFVAVPDDKPGVLASLIRVISSDDPNNPVVTVTSRFKNEICPRIRSFITRSQSVVSRVEVELETMFGELQDSADPINVSLFEVAYTIFSNVNQSSSKRDYSALKAHFPPHDLEGARRRVDIDVLYAVYTAINSRFGDKVLFDTNDRLTPITLTLLPISEENDQNKAIKAMKIIVEHEASQAASRSLNRDKDTLEITSKSTQNKRGSFKVSSNSAQAAIDKAPDLMNGLINAEFRDKSYLDEILATNSTRVMSTHKTNRSIIELIRRFATGDIYGSSNTIRSVVEIFLKHIDHYRALAQIATGAVPKNTPASTLEAPVVDESYAFNYLQKLGLLGPRDDPVRLQSKLKTLEKGAARLAKFHEPKDLSKPLPDRLDTIREQLPDDLTVYCIDDAGAHEIDDGLSVQVPKDPKAKWKVYIHIADPSSALQVDGSSGADGLLRHAYNQTSTAYYPESIIPMFPPWFTQKLGLVEGSNLQRCMTFMVEFDPVSQTFDVDNVQVIAGITRSIKQITYDKVDELLRQDTKTPDKTLTDLRNLWHVANAFSKIRFDSGAVGLAMPQPVLKFPPPPPLGSSNKETVDDVINQISVTYSKRSVARELVAELMILCNHAAARYTSAHDIAGMYRTQDLRLESAAAEARVVDATSAVNKAYDWTATPWQRANDGIGPKLALKETLQTLPLMRAAGLGVARRPHRALGIDAYMHSTSPLRRFQDVVCHWQLGSSLLKDQNKDSGNAYMFDAAQADTMSIRLLRTQSILRRAQQQSTAYWALRHLEHRLAQEKLLGKDSVPVTCIVTSHPFGGTQFGYAPEIATNILIDIDAIAGKPGARVYSIGESVPCTISNFDCVQLTVEAVPIL